MNIRLWEINSMVVQYIMTNLTTHNETKWRMFFFSVL